eukprot:Phypoly_transcript_18219.p1 GENE.Phypoly_transcript_18219~~Phypoly_transcript_18219.p1  ORF type:complete len:228 (+),score=19.17 Phypoly_transcript_18219:72-755(+)
MILKLWVFAFSIYYVACTKCGETLYHGSNYTLTWTTVDQQDLYFPFLFFSLSKDEYNAGHTNQACLPINTNNDLDFIAKSNAVYNFSCAIIDPDLVADMFNASSSVIVNGKRDCSCSMEVPDPGMYITGIEFSLYASQEAFPNDSKYKLHGCKIKTSLSNARPQKGDLFEQIYILNGIKSIEDGFIMNCKISIVIFTLWLVVSSAGILFLCHQIHKKKIRFVLVYET